MLWERHRVCCGLDRTAVAGVRVRARIEAARVFVEVAKVWLDLMVWLRSAKHDIFEGVIDARVKGEFEDIVNQKFVSASISVGRSTNAFGAVSFRPL